MLTSTHWGVYDITAKDGVITRIEPFDRDPDPSAIGQSLTAVTGPVRVRKPAVRKSFLEGGPGTACGKRGAEPFVEVSWDEALNLADRKSTRLNSSH